MLRANVNDEAILAYYQLSDMILSQPTCHLFMLTFLKQRRIRQGMIPIYDPWLACRLRDSLPFPLRL